MKKAVSLIMCLMLILSLVAACGGSGGGGSDSGLIKIGIINNPPSESGYRAANVADMEKVFSTANGYEAFTFYDKEHGPQLEAARGFISDGVDYLLLSAAERVGWDSVLKEAQEAGIKVFLFDRMIDAPSDLFEAAVVSDMRNQGINATNWILAQNFGDDGPRVVHIQGQMGSDPQIGRTEPLMEAVEAGDITLVYQQTASWSEDEAKAIVESVIASQGPDSFNVVYAENDGMAAGAMAALQDAGISHGVDGDVAIIGVDANKWALRHVLNGEWNLNVQCSPFQAEVIHGFIQTLEAGGTLDIPADKIVINPERIFEAGKITEADIATYGLGEEADAPPAAANTDSGLIKIGIINNPPAESGYRAANVEDMERVFNKNNGFEVFTFYNKEHGPQLEAARGFISDGVDYLLLSAAERVGWDSILKDAQEAGVRVFLFDRMIDASSDLFEAAVVSDMRNQGINATNWILAQNFGDDGPKVVHIQGQMGSDPQIGRTEPLMEAVEAGDITLVFQQTASWSEDEAKAIVESVIASQGPGSFNVVYAENDGMAAGAMAALKDAGISYGVDGDVAIIGVDANKWALRHVLNGEWNLNVQCSPFQADVIYGFIQTLEAGGTLDIPDNKIVINPERIFEAGKITEADIATYGLGDE